MSKLRQFELIIYRLFDWLSASMAWLLFFTYRKKLEEPEVSWQDVMADNQLHLGLIIIPACWLLLYSIFDKYQDIYRYSRIGTIKRTFILSLAGVLLLFFTVMLDDTTLKYTSYLNPFLRLFGLHFGITIMARVLLLTWAKQRLIKGHISYNTLIIGGDRTAVELHEEISAQPHQMGHEFLGFIDANGSSVNHLEKVLPQLGKLDAMEEILVREHIEEVIIAIESSDHDKIKSILNVLYDYRDKIMVKIIPDMYDIMLGAVKMNHVYGVGLIEIDQEIMTKPERIIKRLFDLFISSLLFIICLPIYLFIIIRVKFSSKGPLFFKQERIGRDHKPFNIYKFRSMYTDAESSGPQLSRDDDPRITPWGKVMRKWRLDELPQFINVIKGDMSLVGPRPERQFYIDKISSIEPLYKHLLKVRPGITSWGQVKYGYASNVDQMIQRMKFDLIYLENMSLSLDLKILFYTILVLIQGKGK